MEVKMNQETEQENKWREEFEEYVASTNRDVDMQRKLEWEFYRAGRKAGSHSKEYYKARYKEAVKSANEMNLQINTLCAENENLRSIKSHQSDIIDMKSREFEAAKKEVERLKDTVDRHEKMTGVHFLSSGVSGPVIYFEVEKLRNLAKKAKEIFETDYSNEGRVIEQWLSDYEAVMKE